MRRILFAIAIEMFALTSFAQFHGHTAIINPFVRGLLKAQYACAPAAVAKTTALKQRLTGRSEYDAMIGGIIDSFSVSYRGGRGSAFNAEFMDFGQWIGPGFPGFADMIFGYNTDGRHYNKNMGVDVLGDTFRQYSYLPIPPYAFGHYGDQYHVYDVNNNLLDEFWEGDPSVGGNSIEYALRYNSASNIIRASHLTGSGSMVDTLETAFFKYNGSGQMVLDSICAYTSISATYEPTTKYDYKYDAMGHMTMGRSWEWGGSGWIANRSYVMTYYAGTHQLKTCATDTLFSGGLPETLDSFGYTAGSNYSTYSKHVDYTLPGGAHVFEEMRHIGLSGLPDTLHVYDRTAGSHRMYAYTYSPYNNPVKRMDYDSNASTPFINTMNVYYYYEVVDATGLSTPVPANDAMSIYPTPVSNSLYIARKDFAANMPETIRIYNQWGAVVKRETLYRTRETEELSLAELVPGMYTIYVESGGTAETRQIIKL